MCELNGEKRVNGRRSRYERSQCLRLNKNGSPKSSETKVRGRSKRTETWNIITNGGTADLCPYFILRR